MVAIEFITNLDKFRFITSVGLDDFADKCSYLLSFILVLMCFTIVAIKSYVFDPVSCYVPTTFSGSNLASYINAFCWVNGTVPIEVDTDRLDDQAYWNSLEDRKTNYYQWVALVLALQAILCYLPRLIWETITFNRLGTNLSLLVELAQSASNESSDQRKSRVQFVARTLDTILFARRDIKRGKMYNSPLTRQSVWSEVGRTLFSFLPRKRLGTALLGYYLITKGLYLFNSVGQLLLMQRFLGLDSSYNFFGLSILSDILRGRYWTETKVFPRVGFCRVPIKLTSTPVPMVTVQCALPINILNEKVYIFLWFWFVFVATIESISIVTWLMRMTVRQSRLRMLVRYLKVADVYDEKMDPLLTRFEMTFLRLDGSFLLHMLRINAGSLVTQEILQAMLTRYTELERKAQLLSDKNGDKPNHDVDSKKSNQLEPPPSDGYVVTKRVDAV